MPELRNLTRAKPTDAIVDLGDGDMVTISFDRNRITPAWMKLAEKRDAEKDPESLPKALADVILVWDVTNEGQNLEPSSDNISLLSYPAQSELLTRILKAAIPSSEEGNVSSAPSPEVSTDSTAQALASSKNGATSPLPEPSVSPSVT